MKKFSSTFGRGFTLVELLIVITIIGILSSIGLSTFTTAQTKSRDTKRKTQLKQVADSLEAYYNDHGQYPADDGNGSLDGFTWGSSSLVDDKGTVYMIKLPQDPTSGMTYYYDALAPAGSNTQYQLYAYLENGQDPSIITLTGPECGVDKICNYGISSTNTTPEEGRQ